MREAAMCDDDDAAATTAAAADDDAGGNGSKGRDRSEGRSTKLSGGDGSGSDGGALRHRAAKSARTVTSRAGPKAQGEVIDLT
jgi:hypothetical protein